MHGLDGRGCLHIRASMKRRSQLESRVTFAIVATLARCFDRSHSTSHYARPSRSTYPGAGADDVRAARHNFLRRAPFLTNVSASRFRTNQAGSCSPTRAALATVVIVVLCVKSICARTQKKVARSRDRRVVRSPKVCDRSSMAHQMVVASRVTRTGARAVSIEDQLACVTMRA